MPHLSVLDPPGLIVSGAVQQVQHGVTSLGNMVIRGQIDGVLPLAAQNVAMHGEVVVHGPPLDALGRSRPKAGERPERGDAP